MPGITSFVFVTEKVKLAVENIGATNIEFRPITAIANLTIY
jgi:hypothetical protein